MIEHFVPENSEYGGDAHHKRVRHQASAPLHTTNDEEFTRQEVQAALEMFDPVKHREKTPCPVRYSCTSSGVSQPFSRKSTTNV
jgi:hypothetical protein